MKRARELEESPLGRQVLDLLIRNQELAAEGEYPYCQDTGYTVIFLDVGQDVHVVGADLYDAVNEGVRQGYGDGYLRARSSATRLRPPEHRRQHAGVRPHARRARDQIRIQVDAKGAGSENMGKHAMPSPPTGSRAPRSSSCRPWPSRARTRAPGHHRRRHRRELRDVGRDRQARADAQGRPAEPDPQIAELEAELYEKCNALGLGPEALGGTQTVLAVHVETMPTHIASLPVAVNIECHAHRTGSRVI